MTKKTINEEKNPDHYLCPKCGIKHAGKVHICNVCGYGKDQNGNKIDDNDIAEIRIILYKKANRIRYERTQNIGCNETIGILAGAIQQEANKATQENKKKSNIVIPRNQGLIGNAMKR